MGVDPMDVTLEDEEDDLLHMEPDASQTDGEEELKKNLKDMTDLNMLPKTLGASANCISCSIR